MRINDLEEFRFGHAEVAKLVHELPAKTLMNWSEKGLLDLNAPPGRHLKRKYSAVGVIMLAAMHELVLLGVRPSDARAMADGVAARAVALWATEPDEEGEHGERKIVLRPGEVTYHFALITRGDASYSMQIVDAHPSVGYSALHLSLAYVVLQVDFLIIRMLNRMHRHIAGLPVLPAPSPEEATPTTKRKPKAAKKGRRK